QAQCPHCHKPFTVPAVVETPVTPVATRSQAKAPASVVPATVPAPPAAAPPTRSPRSLLLLGVGGACLILGLLCGGLGRVLGGRDAGRLPARNPSTRRGVLDGVPRQPGGGPTYLNLSGPSSSHGQVIIISLMKSLGQLHMGGTGSPVSSSMYTPRSWSQRALI